MGCLVHIGIGVGIAIAIGIDPDPDPDPDNERGWVFVVLWRRCTRTPWPINRAARVSV
jgi:hypothetical protein